MLLGVLQQPVHLCFASTNTKWFFSNIWSYFFAHFYGIFVLGLSWSRLTGCCFKFDCRSIFFMPFCGISSSCNLFLLGFFFFFAQTKIFLRWRCFLMIMIFWVVWTSLFSKCLSSLKVNVQMNRPRLHCFQAWNALWSRLTSCSLQFDCRSIFFMPFCGI